MELCKVNSCHNGGVCVSMAPDGNATCICPNGFDGDFCEEVYSRPVGHIGGLLIVVLFVLVAVLAVMLYRERRKTHTPVATAEAR
ncbi:unnamed protein product, partial [Mesorhabditis spiculigera]